MIVLCLLVQVYEVVVIARMLLSWFRVPTTGALASVARGVHAATEPPIAVIRSVVPPARVGAAGFDLAPVVLLVGLLLVSVVICR